MDENDALSRRELSDRDLRQLRFLRGLVTVLTVTMIAGLLTITTLLVIRLQRPSPPPWPSSLRLPDGATATAVTRGRDWIALVTADDRILVYDADGTLAQEIALAR